MSSSYPPFRRQNKTKQLPKEEGVRLIIWSYRGVLELSRKKKCPQCTLSVADSFIAFYREDGKIGNVNSLGSVLINFLVIICVNVCVCVGGNS